MKAPESSELPPPKATDIFVNRPIVAWVIAITLVLVGLKAASELPVLQYPKVESASLEITTRFVGAPASVVEGFITDPIERVAATVPGVDYVDATTVAGLSTVTAWLNLNEDSTAALAELSARLDQIAFELPREAQDPSVRVVRADRPYAAFYLDVPIEGDYARPEVTDFLTRRVNPQIASIPGVQRVGIEGGRMPAMRVWLDTNRMASYGLSTADVRRALLQNNVIARVGHAENTQQRIDLLTNSTLTSAEDFRRLIIRNSPIGQVRLENIATIALGEEEGTTNARVDYRNVVYISVWPLPGANEIEIGNHLYEVVAEANKTLPTGLSINIAYDATDYMRDALREIFFTLIETVLLVGLVVVIFMGSVRTALVPLITIPISLLGAVAAMQVLGFSLNLLTVLAIVLSVGLVVDDAIVVVENVARHMRNGMSRQKAALMSSRQLLTPIIGMTLTLAAVYAPIGFVSGLTGLLFREFAFALAIAVLLSGVVAVTLSPIMSSHMCPPGGREGRFTRLANAGFDQIQRSYQRVLGASLQRRPQVLMFAIVIALLAAPFYLFSQKELAPTEDQSQIQIIVESPPESTDAYTLSRMNSVVEYMATLPGAWRMWQILNASGGFAGQKLVGPEQRDESVHALLPQAFVGLSGIPSLKVFPVLPPPLPSAGNFDVELVVMGPDTPEQMLPYARELVGAAMASGQFMFADTELKIDMPEVEIRIDRERVADLGLTLQDVSDQLGLLLSGDFVNRFELDSKSYQVLPLVDQRERGDTESVLDYQIKTANGALVPLRAIAELVERPAPRALGRFQQKTSFRVYGGLIPAYTKEQGLRTLEQAAAEILPPEYAIDYAGESRQLRQDGNTLLGVLSISIVFVFLVLAVQFNSFRDPLVVLLGSVPLALSCALLITFLGWTTINIYSQVGLITLVGLVAKNGILIVEFANHCRDAGMAKLEAIHTAACTRLRPVLMTTGATVLGHFPLVLVTGAGAEARNSIGIVLVTGMLLGSFFTLFVLPSVYMLLASNRREPVAKANQPGRRAATASENQTAAPAQS